MRDKTAKFTQNFINKCGLKKIDYKSLEDAASFMGYDVVEYNRDTNNEDVETVIQNLMLVEMVRKSRGFTYADDKYRLIFICESLNEEEKLLVIAHELGHIAMGHLSEGMILGKDVRDEYEANEFAHYLLNRKMTDKCKSFAVRHKKGAVIAGLIAVVIVFISVFLMITGDKGYYGDYYITSSGFKYHKKECIFVKDKKNVRRIRVEEFETGEYEPCGMCLPE
ncbi:MAG: ImmA/IrrE family metallo-endopeptidase [Clostridia bacterium]|nr:ImmA/IrrE family metallo-endopeptidase [Clostridia bacterium]